MEQNLANSTEFNRCCLIFVGPFFFSYSTVSVHEAGGKPSTRFPPGGLVKLPLGFKAPALCFFIFFSKTDFFEISFFDIFEKNVRCSNLDFALANR